MSLNNRKTKIIVTLGPSTTSEDDLRKIKDKGVDFVRVNLSHSSLEYLEQLIKLSKKVGIPFMMDTEGSQIRSGDLVEKTIHFKENDEIVLFYDKDDLLSKIQYYLDNTEERERIAENGRNIVIEQFSSEAIARKTMAFIKEYFTG